MQTRPFETELTILSGLLGRALKRCTIERSSFEGATNANEADRIALELVDNQAVTLELAGDGQSLNVMPMFALAKEWTDWPYGSVHETYTEVDELGGAKIVSLRCVIEAYGGAEYLAGVWVTCEGGFRVGLYNVGDNGLLTFDTSIPDLDEGMTRRVIDLDL